MTAKDKATIRASEIRQRLSELAGVEELNDEQREQIGTLRTEYADVELRLQAATVGEDGEGEPDGENTPGDPKLAELEARASAGEVFEAAVNHGLPDGATRELQDHLGLGGNVIPLALLRSEQEIETRAVTPAPADVGTTQQSIIPAVFPMSMAAFLGVDMPLVPPGEASFPVLSTSASVKTPAENADADETTGAFSSEALSPSRLQASFFFSREDRARFSGMDEALRMNLSEALSDKLDAEIIAGSEGLLEGTNLANNVASAETTFANYITQFGYGRVDGKYAMDTADIRVVMGSEAYAHAGETYRHQNADDLAIDRLKVITGGVKVSAHVPDEVGNKQTRLSGSVCERTALQPCGRV